MGLLGVIFDPEPEDMERQLRAIGLVRQVDEEAFDAHSSSDSEGLTESDINDIPNDVNDAGQPKLPKRGRGGPRPDGGAGGAGAGVGVAAA